MIKKILTSIGVFVLFFLTSCSNQEINSINKQNPKINILEEVEVLEIPLLGEASERTSEISGLCWYGNKLILLPQYPNEFGDENGRIFYIKKNQLLDFINKKDSSAIIPSYFTIDTKKISNLFNKGSGFESITTNGDRVYFTIEYMDLDETSTILISGKIDSTNNSITLDESSIAKDSANISMFNISDESILLYQNKLIPIYEVFGKNLNSNPQVSIFDENLKFIKRISFPNIEYRITDVTSVDNSGNFWAINYLYPGDNKKLNPARDEIISKYGIGKSHLDAEPIERLVEFNIKNEEIILSSTPPIYLKLQNSESRNWEGIAKLDKKGFIIATDTFPKTILAFIKYNFE